MVRLLDRPGVLHEIKNVKQERGPGRRRWFESDGFELVVWFDAANAVTGFQICYDLGEGEHALTWRPGRGFSHAMIDTGDGSPFGNLTPVLSPDSDIPWHEIARVFDERSASLEPGLRRLVRNRLADRAGSMSATPW